MKNTHCTGCHACKAITINGRTDYVCSVMRDAAHPAPCEKNGNTSASI